MSGRKKRRVQWAYKRAFRITCVSDVIRMELPEALHLPADRFVTLYNPYDLEDIRRSAADPCQIERYFPTVAVFGRLDPVKGLIPLLYCIQRVCHEIPHTRFLFVGGGRQRAELEALSERLGVAKNLVFCGSQENPFPFIKVCDLYVMSSYLEGFPNCMVEAMICGLPVVSVDCQSGPREILAPGTLGKTAEDIEYAEYGILTPPFSDKRPIEEQGHAVDCLSAAITEMLLAKELHDRYAAKSNERAMAFTNEAIKARLLELMMPD